MARYGEFIGQQLGNYKLLQLLGEGGFAEVYLGEHVLLKTQVAIKIPRSLYPPDLQSFSTEGKFLASLNHPHILRVLEFNTDGSTPFLVTEFAPYGTVNNLHPKGTMLPLTTVTSYVKQIASALQYIHDKKIIHRNIQPEAMLVGRNKEMLLSDFGIAVSLQNIPKEIPGKLGYTPYMAPEELREELRVESDQYALGLVAYKWLCGSLPFEGPFQEIAFQIIKVAPPSLGEKNPSVPQVVEDVVMKALAKKPEERYESVMAFAEALEKAATPNPVETGLKGNILPDHVGQQVGNYRLIRQLSSSNVYLGYLGESVARGNIVAIKLVPPVFYVEKFLEQAEVLTKLKHPHILPVLDYGTTSTENCYVVMEYVPYGSFHTHYPKGTVLSIATVIPFAKQIANALQYIHDNAFFQAIWKSGINFTIRPENMLLNHNAQILLNYVDDIIYNSENDERSTGISEIIYDSPECLQGRPVVVSDQYSLATIVYEWLGGTLPFTYSQNYFDGYLRQIMFEPPPSLRAKNPAISQAIENVVMKGLAKKPEDRYESITAFAEALERASTAKRADAISEQFGLYRTVRLLGKGDLGAVYLGERIQPREVVAIKVLHKVSDWIAFHDHAQNMVQLQHSNILSIIGYGDENGLPYLIMNYASQGTLRDRHRRGSVVPVETIISYVKQIASALQYAHERGIYGDVRPKKMFIGPNNTILLGGFDFALNKDADPGRKVAKDYFEYRAPEQTQASCTPACNQYALGIMVYEWLSGNIPFRGESVQIMYQHKRVTPPSLREKNPSIPHEVEKVVMKALAKDPEKRYETIQDFAEALEAAITTPQANRFMRPDRSGEQFGKYRLIRRLGQGGFAEVYLGQHIKLKNFVAIKILYDHLTPKQLGELENEAQVVASLEHPSIVRVFDVDVERNLPFLVMDYASKGTMRQFHAKGSRLSLPTVVKYVKQTADALQHAHDQRIIHRDVKPENMLIGTNDTIMLSDFGLAVIAHSSKSWSEQDRAGTAKYMAPEQYKRKAVPASDQYALAVTAYEWLCGAPPFDEGEDFQLVVQHLQEPVPLMSERGAVVSQEVEQVIMKALEKEPAKRFGSVKEFAEALEKAAELG